MKPDWKDSPEWANWLVFLPQDGWAWVEYEPTNWVVDWNCWMTGGCGRVEIINPYKLKERRPSV